MKLPATAPAQDIVDRARDVASHAANRRVELQALG
jgi:hypothetical protein